HFARGDVANRATLDEQQLRRAMTIDLVACAARGPNLADVQGALAEGAHVLQLEARVVCRKPAEAAGIYDDRLLVARRWILDVTPIDVLPNRFVAVLANDAAVGRAARKDAAVELSEVV